MEGNVINLSAVRYSTGSKSGVIVHEFGHIELRCKDSSILEKFLNFCKENDIEITVHVDDRIVFINGEEYIHDKCLTKTYSYDEYIKRIEKSKITE